MKSLRNARKRFLGKFYFGRVARLFRKCKMKEIELIDRRKAAIANLVTHYALIGLTTVNGIVSLQYLRYINYKPYNDAISKLSVDKTNGPRYISISSIEVWELPVAVEEFPYFKPEQVHYCIVPIASVVYEIVLFDYQYCNGLCRYYYA